MTLDPRLDALARGWRGPLLAAMVALIAGLPGLIALPALDRDEARFAQSTAQMLETGDLIDTRFQDQPRSREPIGLHWLQAASVTALSSAEARRIWAYRVPSLLGAMLAAAAAAWGAAAFFGPGAGGLAGVILGSCLILSTEAGIGKPDALLCGAVTLAMASLGRIYGGTRNGAIPGGAPATRRTRLLFWLGLALSVLDKGVVGPLAIAVTILALLVWDRRAGWLRGLGWTWGLILFAVLIGPWLAAVTVRTDGGAWVRDGAMDLAGVGPGGRAPPGLHLLASPLLIFPFAALLPAALVEAWKARAEPGVRFALCWLAPNGLLLEVAPVRLVHQALPLYGAVACLAAFALTRPLGRWTRMAGMVLSLVSGLAIAAATGVLQARIGDASTSPWAVGAGLLTIAAALAGALFLWSRLRLPGLVATLGLGIAAHGVLAAGLAPQLKPLWLSRDAAGLLTRFNLDPEQGLTPGPVTVVGYAEPSIVFALGSETELGDVNDAAEAILEGSPVLVEQAADAAFRQTLGANRLKATWVGRASGLDYVTGRPTALNLYRSDMPPPEPQPLAEPIAESPPQTAPVATAKADAGGHKNRKTNGK
jgi:4-amino-4-deoxy-L-arabinose transferase-like glycosyltransferase